MKLQACLRDIKMYWHVFVERMNEWFAKKPNLAGALGDDDLY
jgi:hypothetical protein